MSTKQTHDTRNFFLKILTADRKMIIRLLKSKIARSNNFTLSSGRRNQVGMMAMYTGFSSTCLLILRFCF